MNWRHHEEAAGVRADETGSRQKTRLAENRPPSLLAGSLVLAALAFGCSTKPAEPPQAAWYSESRLLWGEIAIPATVKFTPADEDLARRVWRRLDRVDEVFNVYRPDSEIARVNVMAEREKIETSDDLSRAVRLAFVIYASTGGAFDVTVGPLVRLWRQAVDAGRPPTDEAIAEALGSIGMAAHCRIGAGTLTVEAPGVGPDRRGPDLTPGVTFDFGGLVKGMAVDWVLAMIKEAGCTAALVQVGGETGAYGVSVRGKRHVIGVQDPLNPADPTDIWTAVQDPGTGISAATSGNYRQPIVIGGKAFYHIIDPRTGRPVDTHTLSVTVVFPETGKNGLADGLSTAAAVLGPDEAIPMVEGLGGEALFLVRAADGAVREVESGGWDALAYGRGE